MWKCETLVKAVACCVYPIMIVDGANMSNVKRRNPGFCLCRVYNHPGEVFQGWKAVMRINSWLCVAETHHFHSALLCQSCRVIWWKHRFALGLQHLTPASDNLHNTNNRKQRQQQILINHSLFKITQNNTLLEDPIITVDRLSSPLTSTPVSKVYILGAELETVLMLIG